MVRDDALGPVEPEARQLGQHAAFVGDRCRQDDIECGEAVARDDDQAVTAGFIHVAYLAAPEQRRAGDVALDERVHSGRTPLSRSRQVDATSRATSAASP